MDPNPFFGLIPELPGIAIDRFDLRCRDAAVLFFLSHCHTDHMIGLAEEKPLNGPLYLSPVSTVLISHRYPLLTENLRSLTLSDVLRTRVVPPDGSEPYELSVRTLPADHCPGSVMFYLETERVRILYTGDFRPTPETRSFIKLIQPNIVYLDTTFLNLEYAHFPTRDESTKKVTELCEEWLRADRKNLISLWLPATYGSEDLVRLLSARLGERIHASENQLSWYLYFPMMHDVVTDDTSVRVHVCRGTKRTSIQPLCSDPFSVHGTQDPRHVRTIRPSALRWRGLKPGANFWERQDNLYYVCYSSHASCNEIGDFVALLHPHVECVRSIAPDGPGGQVERDFLTNALTRNTSTGQVSIPSPSGFKLAGIQYDKRRNISLTESDESDDDPKPQIPKRLRSGD
uniref:Protein artemis n=1 Tax=Anopheles farauti TaxID=69004 RepID=A0A182Q0N4_9DIPT